MRRDLPGWFLAEIDWLVNCSEGEHGRRAVPLEPSLGGSPDTMDDMRARAAARARRVNDALRTLSWYHARLLLVVHEYVGPGRCVGAHAAHSEARARTTDLLEAAALFRRAWEAAR